MFRRMRRSLPLWESIYIELDITKQAIRMDGLWLIKKIYTGNALPSGDPLPQTAEILRGVVIQHRRDVDLAWLLLCVTGQSISTNAYIKALRLTDNSCLRPERWVVLPYLTVTVFSAGLRVMVYSPGATRMLSPFSAPNQYSFATLPPQP